MIQSICLPGLMCTDLGFTAPATRADPGLRESLLTMARTIGLQAFAQHHSALARHLPPLESPQQTGVSIAEFYGSLNAGLNAGATPT